MKRYFAIILLLPVLFSGCNISGCSNKNEKKIFSAKDASSALTTQSTTKAEINATDKFVPPAQIFSIDTSKSDPSNDDITFSFDNYYKITSCTFKSNGFEYNQIYTYDNSTQTVTITTYSSGIAVNEKDIDYSEIADSGYVENVDGYYIKYPPLTSETSKPGESKTMEVTNEYSSYIGTWVTLPSAGVTVVFNSFEGNTAKFFIISNTADASHVATTENISAKVTNDNKIKFYYHDSWDNYGSGTISLNNDSIYLKLVPSKKNGTYGVYCDDKLLKTSDDVWENTFQ